MRLILIAMLALSLQAKSFLISNIPLPVATVMQTGTGEITPQKARQLLQKGYLFSLLAYQSLDTKSLQRLNLHKQALNIRKLSHAPAFKLAFFMAERKIGRYAASTVNSALATLLADDRPYSLDVFDAGDFDTSLQQLQSKNYNLVIAPLLQETTRKLCKRRLSNMYYIPTQHADEFACDNDRVFFGGISYKKQVDSFAKRIDRPVTLISDASDITARIDAYVKDSYEIRKYLHLQQVRNLKRVFAANKQNLHEKVLFLNLPPVSASLFLTQLRLYDIRPEKIYATQILYTPHLFQLTQVKDREMMVIANSIGALDKQVTGYGKLLQNNLRYEWIDFTTAYGLQQFLQGKQTRQFDYSITHKKANKRNFTTIKESSFE